MKLLGRPTESTLIFGGLVLKVKYNNIYLFFYKFYLSAQLLFISLVLLLIYYYLYKELINFQRILLSLLLVQLVEPQ